MPRSVQPARPGSNPRGLAHDLPRRYRRASRLAERGNLAGARRGFEAVAASDGEDRLKALATGDLATLAALAGNLDAARAGSGAALALDPGCRPAPLNLDLLRAEGLDDDAPDADLRHHPRPGPDRAEGDGGAIRRESLTRRPAVAVG